MLQGFPASARPTSAHLSMPQDDQEATHGQLAAREWRTPTLATQGIGEDGPQARKVVLRHADAPLWTLRVYTDARSAKCSELAAKPFGHRRARLAPAGLLEWLVP